MNTKKRRSPRMTAIVKLVEEWRPVLFLQGWDIELAIYDSPCASNGDAAAQCQSKNAYRDAYVDFYPKFFEQSAERQRQIVLHELIHIITGTQNKLVNSSREGFAVSPAEAAYAYEEETSWIEKIITKAL